MRHSFNRQAKLFLLSTILFGIAFSFWNLFFNLYILSSGFNTDVLGLIKATPALAALAIGLPLGKIADRIGHRKAMLIGLAVGISGMIFQIVLHDQWLIVLMGILQGAGFMLYRVAQPPFIMSASDEHNRTMLFSFNFGLMTFAGMVGNLVAGQLPGIAGTLLNIPANSAAAYQLVILSGIALGTTSLIPLFLLKKSKPQNKDLGQSIQSPTLSIKQLFSQKIISRLFLINILVGLGAALLIPYLNVFFREQYAMSDQLLGILYSLSSLLVIIGSISAPYIARLLKSKIVTTVVTQSLSLVFLLVLGFTSALFIAEISFLLRTVLMQLSAPLLNNFAMEISPPGQQSTISSIRGIGWQIGQAVGLFISGLVQTRYGFTPLFITTAILYLISILLTWFSFRSKEKELSPVYG